jgi:DNA-binding NtrC family response regulator
LGFTRHFLKMTTATKTSIVILDHEGTNAFIIECLLKYVGFEGEIITFNSIKEATSHLKEHGASILFIDHYQNETDQFSILKAIKLLVNTPDVVVLWDYNETAVRELSNIYSIRHYFRKPLLYEEAEMCCASLI